MRSEATMWTCPTCGTEKGDCESGHGTAPVRDLFTDEQYVEAALNGEIPYDDSRVHHAIRRLLQKDQRENAA